MSWFKKIFSIAIFTFVILLIVFIILISIYQNESIWIALTILLLFFYIINTIVGIYIFFNNKRRDLTKKCWLFAFLLFPGIGILIFLWTGFNPYHKKKIKKLKEEQIYLKQKYELNYFKKSKNNIFNSITNYCLNNNDINTASTANIEFIVQNEKLYEIAIDLIKSAKKIILLNYYLLDDGVFLRSLVNELKLQKDKGVKIYILYDWVGSRKKIKKDTINKLNDYGIVTKTFKPKKSLIVNSNDNSRSHKKSLIIDDKIALIGGFNIADEYINSNLEYHYWKDHIFKIKGPAIWNYIKSFLLDWTVYTNGDTNELENDLDLLFKQHTQFIEQNCNIKTINSFPENRLLTATNIYSTVFTKAEKRIWINTPYFYPTEYLEQILINAAQSGVDVRIVLSGLPDNKKFIINVNRSKYRDWISKNIKIYEINAFNHAKSIIIDNDISILGTVNLDPRALNINYESILLVESKKINKDLEKDFLDSFKSAELITQEIKETNIFKWIYDKMIVKLLLFFEPLL